MRWGYVSMSDARGKKRPQADKVKKFCGEFPDLIYNGCKIMCKICNIPLMCIDKYGYRRHVNSKQHKNKKLGIPPTEATQFIIDLFYMLTACNLPFSLLRKKPFREFWNKYNPDFELPSETSLRRCVPSVRTEFENRIRSAIKNKQLWLCIDETTDRKKILF